MLLGSGILIIAMPLPAFPVVGVMVNATLDFGISQTCVVIRVHHLSSCFAFRTHVELTVFRLDSTYSVGNEVHIFLSVDVHHFGGTDHGVSFLSNVIGRSYTFVSCAQARVELTVPIIALERACRSNMVSWMSELCKSLMVLASSFLLNTA